MTATSEFAPPPARQNASPPPASEPSDGEVVVFARVPHPLQEADLLSYDLIALSQALRPGPAGQPLRRLALGGDAPPDEAEVRTFENRLRRQWTSRERAANGRAIGWLLAGPALALLWVNLAPFIALLFFWIPPVAAFIATLGGVAGGAFLAIVIGSLPLLWAWRRALEHLRHARRWRRLASGLRTRRYRDAPLECRADPEVGAFTTEAAPLVSQLRALAPQLAERGAVGAAEAAQLARALYRAAVRHGITGAASAFHALYARFDAAEQRLHRFEGNGGVLSERKARAEAQRARRATAERLSQYATRGKLPSSTGAVVAAPLAGLAALLAVVLLTGIYWVEPGQAVIVDPPPARLLKLLAALGLGQGPDEDAQPFEIVRATGLNWGVPRPFAERHSVTLGEQQTVIQARFRQTGPNEFDVLFVALRFRIADLPRWAARDADGRGGERLSIGLSQALENYLGQRLAEAGEAVRAQQPALPPDQVAARAYQLVESRMEELVRNFVQAVAASQAATDAGIQVSREFQHQLLRQVPGDVASAHVP